MFGFMVTADGGLTTAGYVITVIAGIILFFLAIYFAGKNSDKKKLTTRQLVFCAVAIALAFITSYLKIFKLPWGHCRRCTKTACTDDQYFSFQELLLSLCTHFF